MLARLQAGWGLFKQSWAVLWGDKQLVLFPLLSSAALLLVLISFAVPMAVLVDWTSFAEQAKQKSGGRVPLEIWHYAVLGVFYFVNFFVITFFNVGLVSCAISKFRGGDASLSTGIRAAVSLLPQILAWSLVAASVGVVLKAIEERAGLIGSFVIRLIGMAWAIATFFVVPVLVVERVGPIEAVKRSAMVLRKTWGESLALNLGIGAVSGLLGVLALLPLIGGVVAAIAMGSVWPAVAGGAVTVLAIVVISLVTSALKGIVLAATYEYASTGAIPAGFDAAVLQQAFKTKVKK